MPSQMDKGTLKRRSEIAKRLKSARWLSATVRPTTGRGAANAGWKLRELGADELAARSPLQENGWLGHRIGRIERMQRDTTPVELDLLERALGMPGLFDEIRMQDRPLVGSPPSVLLPPPAAGEPTGAHPLRSSSHPLAEGQG